MSIPSALHDLLLTAAVSSNDHDKINIRQFKSSLYILVWWWDLWFLHSTVPPSGFIFFTLESYRIKLFTQHLLYLMCIICELTFTVHAIHILYIGSFVGGLPALLTSLVSSYLWIAIDSQLLTNFYLLVCVVFSWSCDEIPTIQLDFHPWSTCFLLLMHIWRATWPPHFTAEAILPIYVTTN